MTSSGFSHRRKVQFFCLDAATGKTLWRRVQVLRRYTVAEARTWAHLAVVDDGILVKDAGSLAYLRL